MRPIGLELATSFTTHFYWGWRCNLTQGPLAFPPVSYATLCCDLIVKLCCQSERGAPKYMGSIHRRHPRKKNGTIINL